VIINNVNIIYGFVYKETKMEEMSLTTMHYTRPNISVSWGPLIRPPHIQEHYDNHYVKLGYIVKEETKQSDDGLVLTRKIAWTISSEIYEKYINDSVIQNYLAQVRQYNKQHRIQPSVTPEAFAAAQQLQKAGIIINPFRKISSIDEF